MTIRIDGTNTTASPGITGGDTGTGLVYGTDEVKIVTGGTTRATVDSGGKLLLQAAQQFQYNTASTDSRTWYLNNDIHAYGDFAFRRSTTQTGSTFETKILFKDTGGICFNGDTAAANALDDYEEGTWTVSCNGGVTVHSGLNLASYTKIGRQVTVTGQFRVNSGNSQTALVVNSLPFACATESENEFLSVGSVRLYNAGVRGTCIQVICVGDNSTTDLYFNEMRDNSGDQAVAATDNGYYLFTFTYPTA